VLLAGIHKSLLNGSRLTDRRDDRFFQTVFFIFIAVYEKGSQETALPLTAFYAVSDLLPSKPTAQTGVPLIRRILLFPFHYSFM